MARSSTILFLALCSLFSSCKESEEARNVALADERKQVILKKHAAYEEELQEARKRKLELEYRQLEIKRKFDEAEAKRQLIEEKEADFTAKALAKKAAYERKTARKAILNKKFSALTLRDGTRYQNVEVIKVSNSGITIKHRHGARGIDFHQLPHSVQLACKYDPYAE
ncbi:MAG: hypothetical protein ABGY95_10110 [Rubritalea sp.]|uniref:hypothetical protein n=1 Tax=Rubritalea sp. TaxID=2109375 RepID=UPI0032429FFF